MVSGDLKRSYKNEHFWEEIQRRYPTFLFPLDVFVLTQIVLENPGPQIKREYILDMGKFMLE